MGWQQLKESVRQAIASRRRSGLVRLAHRAAEFIELAYANNSMDFHSNGEEALIRRLRTADPKVALDVGANVGDWSLSAAREWPAAQIHAFEVAPLTFTALNQALAAAPAGARVTPHPLGVSDKAGKVRMFYYPEHPDTTCDVPRHGGPTVPFDGKMTTLDAFCDKQGIAEIDFVKIDVEGVEYKVLQGAARLIGEDRIKVMQFEYGAFSVDTRKLLADFYTLLESKFWIGKIYPDHVEFADYSWRAEDFKFCNYACVSRRCPELKALAEGSVS